MAKRNLDIKVAALSLCGVLLMQLGGWFFLTKSVMGVGQIRQHWTAAHNQPVSFVFTENHFERISDGNGEIIHQGSFYDIKSVQRHDGRIHVTAIPDNFEDGMLAFFKSFSGHDKQSSKDFKVLPVLKFLLPNQTSTAPVMQSECMLCGIYQASIPFQPVSFPTPPPETFFV
jgi:hypothetical protein